MKNLNHKLNCYCINAVIKLLMCAVVFVAASFQQTPATVGLKAGDAAVDFSLKDCSGKMVSLNTYQKEKGLLLVFTCNHCPFSQAYEQRIIQLHKDYAGKGIPVLAINPNDATREPEDSYENMQIRAKKMRYPFAYALDETQQIAKSYGAIRTPHVFLLSNSSNGWKVYYVGAIDDNFEEPEKVTKRYAEDAMNALLQNRTPELTYTKAIGCGIKWKK